MSQSHDTRQSLGPDDALPPVEPPSAGFILQLFIIPAVIVLIIVVLWLMFSWLAHMGDNPNKYIEALRRNNPARWQAASSLADALRRPGNERLKNDSVQARALASLLSEEIDAGEDRGTANDIKLRAFLARALGEFNVPDVLPTLLKAAKTQRYENELMVRRAAIEAIAVLASNVGPARLRDKQGLVEALIDLSQDEQATIRSATAYTLGVVGGAEAAGRLEHMLDDAQPSVRYNAATGLARQGDLQATAVLIEMLEPRHIESAGQRGSSSMQAARRLQIRITAMRALKVLFEKQPQADDRQVRAAVRELLKDKELKTRTRIEAKSLLQDLEARHTGG